MPVQNTFSVQCIIHTHKFSVLIPSFTGLCAHLCSNATAVRWRTDVFSAVGNAPLGQAARRRSDGGPTYFPPSGMPLSATIRRPGNEATPSRVNAFAYACHRFQVSRVCKRVYRTGRGQLRKENYVIVIT